MKRRRRAWDWSIGTTSRSWPPPRPAKDTTWSSWDEAQDLSANQIRAVQAHLNEDHTTTFILDAVQRIYPQAFQWREVDVAIRPNMVYTLKKNHRQHCGHRAIRRITRTRPPGRGRWRGA